MSNKVTQENMRNLPYIIAVDFDGTIVRDEFPTIGSPKPEVINNLKAAKELGAKLILWTCRNDLTLSEAIEFCIQQGLGFDAINCNLPEVIELFGGDTRKVYADEYWDDKASLNYDKCPKWGSFFD